MSRLGFLAALLWLAGAGAALALETVPREQEIGEVRLGQRIYVDDGACPQGQIKEVSGAQLSSSGVVRVVRCVPRPGSRR
jgi:hypothetical protein